ncbi:MAG TPA: hypothetical protein VNE67_10460 [Acetobacteraceae bacterium]|nr:hypothetical protein [Acetobacteraceae bacterium]
MNHLAEPLRIPSALRPRAVASRPCRTPLVLVVEDGVRLSEAIYGLCEFLHVGVATIGGEGDLARTLRDSRPMAVLAEMDGKSQDGGYVMMRIAEHDRTLPLMLLTGPDPALVGAAEAIEELCDLSAVARHLVLPTIGEVVEFLFRAGQSGSCLGLMPA